MQAIKSALTRKGSNMATKLDSFTFTSFGRDAVYPWDEWLDGGIYKLVQGEDFDCKLNSIRQGAFQAARTRRMAIHTSVVDDGKALVLQAYPMTPEQLERLEKKPATTETPETSDNGHREDAEVVENETGVVVTA